jgi:hypothetical protein
MSRHVMFRLAILAGGVSTLMAAGFPLNRDAPVELQRLPEPWIGMRDDIQYFAPGPEFKLSREAAAQKAYQADLDTQQTGP